MAKFFVNHDVNKIYLSEPGYAALFIFLVVLMLSVATIQRKDIHFLDLGTSLVFRGLAILLLLAGHFLQMCLPGNTKMPVEGGFLAVNIFLFLSGYGLVQRYGLNKIEGSFWSARLLRLYIPLWLTLTLFIFLDRMLLGLSHPFWEIIMNYCGVMLNGAFVRVNSPAWFVGYILLQYIVFFFLVRCSGLGGYTKVVSQFIVSLAIATVVNFTFLFNYFSIWIQYTLVFPLGVMFGALEYKITKNCTLLAPRRGAFASIVILILSTFSIIIFGRLQAQIGYHPKLFLQQIAVLIVVISLVYHSFCKF